MVTLLDNIVIFYLVECILVRFWGSLIMGHLASSIGFSHRSSVILKVYFRTRAQFFFPEVYLRTHVWCFKNIGGWKKKLSYMFRVRLSYQVSDIIESREKLLKSIFYEVQPYWEGGFAQLSCSPPLEWSSKNEGHAHAMNSNNSTISYGTKVLLSIQR